MSAHSGYFDSDEPIATKLYSVKLKYPLLPPSIIIMSKCFSILPLKISAQSVTDKYNPLQLVYSLTILSITLYHIYITPYVINNLQYESKEFNITSSSVYYRTVQIAFPVVLSVAAVVSKFTTLYMLKTYIMRLYKCLYYSDLYNSAVFHPNNESYHRTLSLVLIATCLAINVSLNVVRYNQLTETNIHGLWIAYFLYMYFNSIQVYITELQFIILAYGLYIRFQDINLYLYQVIKENSLFYNRNYKKEYFYTRLLVNDPSKPPVSSQFKKPSRPGLPEFDSFNKNFLNLKCHTIANLRIAHIFLCDSLSYLNSIYDYSLIFSLVCLFITTLLDIYYEFFGIVTETAHSQIRTYLWIIQYCVRFIGVVEISHVTSSEGRKARSLIANISNRNLDVATKEELTLFSNHVASRNIEFTAGGFFSLNTHLITSAIAAGTTYLVILVQFNAT